MPPPPSPSLFLLNRLVHACPPGFDTDDIQGRVLTTGEKLAFGFPAHDEANSVVQDLELEAVLTRPTDPSFLILRGANLYTGIHTVDKNLVLIASAFTEVYPDEVFLIYNEIERSLHMIPSMPCTYPPFRTAHVLVARCHDNDKSYALVFPGQKKLIEGNPQPQDVLFVSHSSSASPWQKVKMVKIPDHLRSDSWFVAEEVFSSRGRGYWVDLLVGIMYCVCGEVISDCADRVNIHSLDLPMGCQKYLGCKENIAQARAFRAIGPVGDSIKFVSIDGYIEPVDLKDCKVRVWTLMEDTMSWDVEFELKLLSLWNRVEFRGNFIPTFMSPMYPFLSTHEDHVIYFALGFMKEGKIWLPGEPCFMIRVDLRSKTYHCGGLGDSQRARMASHRAISSNAEGKLLGLELPAIPSDC